MLLVDRTLRGVLLAMILVAPAARTEASPFTISYEGTVRASTFASIPVGTHATATITIDPSAAMWLEAATWTYETWEYTATNLPGAPTAFMQPVTGSNAFYQSFPYGSAFDGPESIEGGAAWLATLWLFDSRASYPAPPDDGAFDFVWASVFFERDGDPFGHQILAEIAPTGTVPETASTTVPEPATLLMLAIGLGGLGARRKVSRCVLGGDG